MKQKYKKIKKTKKKIWVGILCQWGLIGWEMIEDDNCQYTDLSNSTIVA